MSCSAVIALSVHLGLSHDYNGVHPGISCEFDSQIVAGAYYNSDRKISVFAGLRTRPSKSGFWAEIGLATGYEYPIVPMARAGYRSLFVAPAYETSTESVGIVIGTELKF